MIFQCPKCRKENVLMPMSDPSSVRIHINLEWMGFGTDRCQHIVFTTKCLFCKSEISVGFKPTKIEITERDY